jgi:hypothetical protein
VKFRVLLVDGVSEVKRGVEKKGQVVKGCIAPVAVVNGRMKVKMGAEI